MIEFHTKRNNRRSFLVIFSDIISNNFYSKRRISWEFYFELTENMVDFNYTECYIIGHCRSRQQIFRKKTEGKKSTALKTYRSRSINCSHNTHFNAIWKHYLYRMGVSAFIKQCSIAAICVFVLIFAHISAIFLSLRIISFN